MDTLTDILVNYGYWGMLLSAFLAGSFFPFSSEVVMLTLLAAGLSPISLILYGTLGNVMGGFFNYGIGSCGRMDWIERYLHVKPESLDKARRFMRGHGAWTGFFAFVPILGSAITVVLGLMRANILISFVSITTGKFLRYLLLVYGANLFISCSSPQAADMKTITVTIEPLRYFTEQVAGDRYRVTTLVPSTGNPETYEPTPRQMKDLSSSTLYIKVGQIGIERNWMEKLQQNAPRMKVVDASKGITLIESSHGIKDPHIWMSCTNARQMAENIYAALAADSPEDSTYFRRRLTRLLNDIQALDRTLHRQFHGHPQAFCIYHPALTYFAADYRLHQIPIEEEGREPSARQLQALIEQARSRQVKVVFTQKQFSDRHIQTVVRATNARSVVINPLGYDWPKEMKAVASALASAAH